MGVGRASDVFELASDVGWERGFGVRDGTIGPLEKCAIVTIPCDLPDCGL